MLARQAGDPARSSIWHCLVLIVLGTKCTLSVGRVERRITFTTMHMVITIRASDTNDLTEKVNK